MQNVSNQKLIKIYEMDAIRRPENEKHKKITKTNETTHHHHHPSFVQNKTPFDV